MANWCEGWVKFRGTLDNLKRFIKCEFEQSEPFIIENELSPCMREKTTFLKSLVRTYVESDDVSRANYEVFCDDDGIGLFIIKLNHAWNVQRQGYNELAKSTILIYVVSAMRLVVTLLKNLKLIVVVRMCFMRCTNLMIITGNVNVLH